MKILEDNGKSYQLSSLVKKSSLIRKQELFEIIYSWVDEDITTRLPLIGDISDWSFNANDDQSLTRRTLIKYGFHKPFVAAIRNWCTESWS